MPDDAEIESLAREILTQAVEQVVSWDAHFFHEIHEMNDGELIPVYGATSEEGCGSFLCEYMPLAAIKKIIRDCEQIFDEFEIVMTDKQSGIKERRLLSGHLKQSRDRTIRWMAELASLNLVAFFYARLTDLLEETVKDCRVIANAALAAVTVQAFETAIPDVPIKADARSEIEEAAERVADKLFD